MHRKFHVILWNLNFENDVIGEVTPNGTPLIQEFVKENAAVFVKRLSRISKEFVKKSPNL